MGKRNKDMNSCAVESYKTKKIKKNNDIYTKSMDGKTDNNATEIDICKKKNSKKTLQKNVDSKPMLTCINSDSDITNLESVAERKKSKKSKRTIDINNICAGGDTKIDKSESVTEEQKSLNCKIATEEGITNSNNSESVRERKNLKKNKKISSDTNSNINPVTSSDVDVTNHHCSEMQTNNKRENYDIPKNKLNKANKKITSQPKNKLRDNNIVYEDEANIRDEDIDKFCNELSAEDNKQFEDWVKLVEANLHSNKSK